MLAGAGNSLTTALRQHGDPATIAQRRATKRAANARNKQNQIAIGNWHRAIRGKSSEVPFPERRMR